MRRPAGSAAPCVSCVPVLAVLVAIGIWIGKRGKGQRNPAGRAVADQLIGFRKYLATAEADQLRFEEGEDIFSKYLPWAIVFGLADRWQKVCEQLVAAGRLTPDPYWYAGRRTTPPAGPPARSARTVAQYVRPAARPGQHRRWRRQFVRLQRRARPAAAAAAEAAAPGRYSDRLPPAAGGAVGSRAAVADHLAGQEVLEVEQVVAGPLGDVDAASSSPRPPRPAP